MSEQLDLNGARVLLVCMSGGWGSLERRALGDAKFMRDRGAKVELYLLKKSSLAIKAEAEKLSCHYIKQRSLETSFNLVFYKNLKKTLDRRSYDFVHCFGVKELMTVCFVMLRKRAIPLFLSVNSSRLFAKTSYLQRWLIRRVDRILVSSSVYQNTIPLNLNIPKAKVKFLGLGIKERGPSKEGELNIVLIWDQYLEKFLSQSLRLVSELREKFNLPVMLFYDEALIGIDQLSKLKNNIISMGYADFIGIRKLTGSPFQGKQILLNLSPKETISDWEIRAIMEGAFVVAPRTLARSNARRVFFGAFQTYQYGNYHDLQKAVSYLIDHKDILYQDLQVLNKEAKFYHGLANYMDLQFKQYRKIRKRRFRYHKE